MQPEDKPVFTYPKEIYYQGFFDGACFLYSVANVFKALTGKDVEGCDWNEATEVVPYTSDFMRTNGGTDRYDSDLVHYTLSKLLLLFKGRKHSKFQIKRLGTTEFSCLAKNIDADTVILFAIESKLYEIDHWLCAVGFRSDPLKIHLACSSPHDADYNDDYSVRPDEKFKSRYYNWELTNFKDFKIQQDTCYAISKL